jgi:DNA adenine methylase
MQAEILRAPFPWFGGKALATDLIWSRFGSDIKNYVEPFFGSGAVMLNKPPGTELITAAANDLDGYVCNFWRSVAADPDKVAFYANSPVNEIDLQARHQWLVNSRNQFTEKLKADPDFFCCKSAGWWAWGCCCWIGGGWCAERNTGQGVNRQLPHLRDAGRGVNRKLPHLGDALFDDRHLFLSEWFKRLEKAIARTRFTCGDWERICSAGTITRLGKCAVLLDPPYDTTDFRYSAQTSDLPSKVENWCVENGQNKKIAIALCGHEGQYQSLEDLGWTVETWKKPSGYQGADGRERIWFSPSCPTPEKNLQIALF